MNERAIPWREFAAEAEARLRHAGVESPGLNARRIVERAAGVDSVEYHQVLDELATTRGVAHFDAMMARREKGEPLQYVVGRWGFRHLDLYVDQRVLIPRPETEVVTGIALDEIDRVVASRAIDGRLPVADLGTGSGAIGLSMAFERPVVDVWLSDLSSDAIAVARANLAGIGRAATRVAVVEGSWFDALPSDLAGRLGVVVSNPPYVGADEELPAEVVEWEPHRALVSGPTGLEATTHLIDAAPTWLRPGGALVIELAPAQADEAAGLAEAAGYGEVEIHDDLADRPHALVARR